MITQRFEPDSLSPAELDGYLARGWYRIGRTMITTDWLENAGELRSAVWTRLDLRTHRFRSSLRKRMAKNARLLRVEFGPFVLDAAHETLYSKYRDLVGGKRAESLDDVLGGDAGRRLFDTREISIYSGDELVAFSWFDFGETSVQSLIGVYHPEYRKLGLGFYTLLLEIEQAAAMGMHYHYSGYILCEPSGMDYKRQVGSLEYLDPAAGTWLPESPHAPGESPAEVLRRRLREANEVLTLSGSRPTHVLNSALLIPGLRDQLPRCSTEPILVFCSCVDKPWGVLVTWDLQARSWVLYSGRPVAVTLDGGGAEPVDIHLFLVHGRLGAPDTNDEMAFWVRYHLASFERA